MKFKYRNAYIAVFCCAFITSCSDHSRESYIEYDETYADAADGTASGLAIGLLVATFIDIAVDGFIIGAGFASGGETGLILALGLSVELLFLGLALMSDALRGWKMIALTCLLGVEVFAFAVLGKWLLAGVSHDVLGAVLAASAAASAASCNRLF